MCTGFEIGMLATAVLGAGAAATTSVQQKHAAEKQAKAQEEANAQQEKLAKQQAGQASSATQTVESVGQSNAARSALRRTILTQNQQSSSKLGD